MANASFTPQEVEIRLKKNKETAIKLIHLRMQELNDELDQWNQLLYRMEEDNV